MGFDLALLFRATSTDGHDHHDQGDRSDGLFKVNKVAFIHEALLIQLPMAGNVKVNKVAIQGELGSLTAWHHGASFLSPPTTLLLASNPCTMRLRSLRRRTALLSSLFLMPLLVTMPRAWAQIVITEIMATPAAVDGREPTELEFIELTNLGEQVVDLTGWAFDRGVDYRFPAESSIAPNAYLVIAADPQAFTARYPEAPKPFGPWVGQLGNRGNTIRLVNASGDTVDRVSYSDEGDWANRTQVTIRGQLGWEWQAPHDGAGASLPQLLSSGHLERA